MSMRTPETVGAETDQMPLNFERILGDLAQDMRLYDELNRQKSDLKEAKQAVLAELEDIDLQVSLELQPENLAPAALHAYIIDRQIAELGQRLPDDLGLRASQFLYLDGLMNRKVIVETMDPERNFLGTSTSDGQGLSKWHASKKGRVTELGLNVSDGGYIAIRGRMGQIYSAYPLIDRGADYQPAFSIQHLK